MLEQTAAEGGSPDGGFAEAEPPLKAAKLLPGVKRPYLLYYYFFINYFNIFIFTGLIILL